MSGSSSASLPEREEIIAKHVAYLDDGSLFFLAIP